MTREIRASRADMPFLRCGGAELLLFSAMDLIGEGLILLVDRGAKMEEGESRSIFTLQCLGN